MMDVMNANIGGKPAHDARQIEIRAAMKRRLVQAPDAITIPGGVLELVLDLEQPDSDRSRQQHDR